MKMNWTRKFESIVKPAYIVGAVLVLLMLGFCREAEADVAVEVGPTIASGEYTEGQALLFTEYFDNKYGLTLGYITDQVIEDRSETKFYARPNFFIQGNRYVGITERLYGGIGVAYFNSTNRALGCKVTANLTLQWRASDRVYWNIRHYSNAGSCSPNMGQDLFTISYKF